MNDPDNSSFAMSPAQKKGLLKEIVQKNKQITALDEAKASGDMPSFLNANKAVELAERLKKLHHEFFDADRPKKKKELKAEIEKLEWQLIETSLREKNKADKIPDIQKLQRHNVKPYFLWKLHFNEVFTGDNGGFDIVIANPPYGANIDGDTKILEVQYPRTTKSFKDIYKIFFELSIGSLLSKNGVIAFITPNTFLTQPRYKDLRDFLLNFSILSILNLGENVFEAVVPTVVCLAQNTIPDDDWFVNYSDLSVLSKYSGSVNEIKPLIILQKSFHRNSDLSFIDVEKDYLGAIPLEQILDFKDAGINYQRVKVGLSEKGKSDLGQRLLYEGEKENPEDVQYWKGADIDGCYIKPQTKRYVRLSTISHLQANERVILNDAYFSIAPKIVWRQTAEYPIAAVDTVGIWFGRSIQAGLIKQKYQSQIGLYYLVAVLNSTFIRWVYLEKVREGGRVFPQVKLEKLKSLPIILAEESVQERIADKVLKITSLKKQNPDTDVSALEAAINAEVYKLYHLTDAEIAIIEQAVP